MLITRTPPKRALAIPRFVLLIAALCLTLFGMIKSTTITLADSIPGGNVADPVVRGVDIAEPSIVRILTTVNGRLTVNFSATQSVTFPQDGSAGYPLELSGTGSFITAHGDILTADHVVNPPHDSSLDQFLDKTAAKDVAAYYNSKNSNNPITGDQVAQALINGQLASSTQYGQPSSEVFLSTSYTGSFTAQSINSIPAEDHSPVDRIEQQSLFNDKDVAIVHVSNMDDMPTVQLGDSSNVHQQDQLTIIGFPGNGDINESPNNFLAPSVNTVIVSSIKIGSTGGMLLQVGGNVEHGDSGGPALDNNGNVVGIVSFGTVTSGPGNTSFLQASSSAMELVQGLHLNTTPGKFENAWRQAFTDYAASTPGHWHKAQQEFQQITTSYSLFQAITPYLTYTKSQAANERLPQPKSQANSSSVNTGSNALYTQILAGVGIAIFIVLLILLLLAARTLRRRRSQNTAAGTPVTAQPFQAQPLPQPNTFSVPAQGLYGPQQVNGMTAFGAPPTASRPVQNPTMQQTMPPRPMQGPPQIVPSNGSTIPAGAAYVLRPWPCGHMNRSNARYCSVCGEPAPPPPAIRRYEQ